MNGSFEGGTGLKGRISTGGRQDGSWTGVRTLSCRREKAGADGAGSFKWLGCGGVTRREQMGCGVPEPCASAREASRGWRAVAVQAALATPAYARGSLHSTAREDAGAQVKSGSVVLPNARAYVRHAKSLCQHSPERKNEDDDEMRDPTADELGKGHPKSARLPAHLRACPAPASRATPRAAPRTSREFDSPRPRIARERRNTRTGPRPSCGAQRAVAPIGFAAQFHIAAAAWHMRLRDDGNPWPEARQRAQTPRAWACERSPYRRSAPDTGPRPM